MAPRKHRDLLDRVDVETSRFLERIQATNPLRAVAFARTLADQTCVSADHVKLQQALRSRARRIELAAYKQRVRAA